LHEEEHRSLYAETDIPKAGQLVRVQCLIINTSKRGSSFKAMPSHYFSTYS